MIGVKSGRGGPDELRSGDGLRRTGDFLGFVMLLTGTNQTKWRE